MARHLGPRTLCRWAHTPPHHTATTQPSARRRSGWGFKAQQVLGAVRGKDFRHEKTKKKRGSYKGGLIDPHASFSYKFDSDNE